MLNTNKITVGVLVVDVRSLDATKGSSITSEPAFNIKSDKSVRQYTSKLKLLVGLKIYFQKDFGIPQKNGSFESFRTIILTPRFYSKS